MLLTAYADTDVAIKAINDIGLDYYLLKPWDPPEERLYPVLDDLLDDWQRRAPRDDDGELRVVGHRWSERSHEIKTFLARNHVPYRWLDLERDDEAQRLHELADAAPDRPAARALVPEGDPLRGAVDPRARRARSGCARRPSSRCTTSASSGRVRPASPPRCTAPPKVCRRVVIEREAPGRPGRPERGDRELPRLPAGLSGADLTHRAVAQVQRFGAEMVLARDVVGLRVRGPVRARAASATGREIEAAHRAGRHRASRTGCSTRPGSTSSRGRGVYYGATASEARAVRGRRRVHRRRRQLGRSGRR